MDLQICSILVKGLKITKKYYLKVSRGFSQLFLVEECKTGHKWALKRIDCHSKTDVERVRNEIDVQRRFGMHPNILSLECFTDDEIPHGLRFSLIFTFYKVYDNFLVS